MRITVVLGPFQPLPPDGFGAVEKVWHELAPEFARMGHEVILLGKGGPHGAAPGDVPGVRRVLLPGFAATGRLWRDLPMDFAYALQAASHLEPSDVIVTNTFWAPVLFPLLARGRGRIVVHVARFPKGQMGLYRGADVLQAISSPVAKAIAKQSPGLKDKVHVVPYPVDLATYRLPATPRRFDADLSVLYVGRVHPEKGVDLLVAAFRSLLRRVPRARLRIVGSAEAAHGGGGAAYLDALKAAAAGLPVEFAGPVREPGRLALEYQRAQCFCYPSLAEAGEALGLAVLEAMATGAACVVSRLECFADFLGNGIEGVVFDHRSPAAATALADALAAVLLDPQRAAALGARARTRAEQYSVARVAGAYLGLFETVVANGSRRNGPGRG